MDEENGLNMENFLLARMLQMNESMLLRMEIVSPYMGDKPFFSFTQS